MCGIFGVSSSSELAIEKNILPHRGPDDWGVEYHHTNLRHITFFHSRLSIIGIGKQGHQPYCKLDSHAMLIYNGEIYNYKQLRTELNNKFGVEFQTTTDTEVLYEAINNFGIEETLKKVNGIFAFAYLQKDTNKIFLARDHLGVKPVYYHFSDEIFTFSSEVKSFFELKLCKPSLNRKCLGEYFANGWVYEPDTLFDSIYKVKAGHYLEYSIHDHSVCLKRYWDVDSISSEKIDIESIIHKQTVSDVPIGVYFSGGVDSSIITHTLKDKDIVNLNLDLHDSESNRVKLMARQYGLRIIKIAYDRSDLTLYDKLIYYLDEPIADPAIIPAYLLANKSRQMGIPVMLSGMGGDEIDAGYTRHRIILNLRKYSLIKYIPYWVLSLFKSRLRRDLHRLKAFLSNPVPENYFSITGYLTSEEIDEVLLCPWKSLYQEKVCDYVKKFEESKRFFYLDMKGFLASHNLLYMDKASMASSVEVRVPLLDKDLVAAYFSNIESANRNKGKSRLVKLLRSKLKENYSDEKKQGFRYPIHQWIKNDINWAEIVEYFDSNKILNTKIIKNWISKIETATDVVSMKLWYVYTLYTWMNTFSVKT